MNDLKLKVGAAGASAMALAGLIWGCAHAAPPAPGSAYVAMGSSYAAGTGLSQTASDSPGRCDQGTDNYPRQVARALRLRLVDRSCGGATTEHVLKGGQFGLPAQLDAVDADTKLVTLTIGGNDVRFVADLGRYSCGHRGADVSDSARPFVCSSAPDFREDEAFVALEANLRQIVRTIRQRAPAARIVFVDYMTVLPDFGTCAALAFDANEASIMRARAARLGALTAKIAAATGSDLVMASKVSHGHDICAAQPWAWGFVPSKGPAKPEGVGFHPRLVGTTAVADAIIQHLQH